MKRLFIFVMAIIMLFSSFGITTFAATADDVEIIINGKMTTFTPAVVVEKMATNNFQILVPAQDFADKIGAKLEWNDKTEELFLKKEDKFAKFKMDDTYATQNSIREEIPLAARVIGSTKYVPLEFTGDALGYHVLREHSGLRVRLVSKTSTYAPAIDDQPLKPGTAELTNEYGFDYEYERKNDGKAISSMRFSRSNRLDDLIYNRTDYSNAIKKFERSSPVKGGTVLFDQDDLFDFLSKTEEDGWAHRGKEVKKVPVEQNKKISVDVFTSGDSIGRTYKDKQFLPFTEAIEVNQTEVRNGSHDMDLDMYWLPSHNADDNYIVSFYARRISGGDEVTETASMEVYITFGGGRYLETSATFGDEWQKFEFLHTGGTGSQVLRLNLGMQTQVFQIGGFELKDVGKDTDVSYYNANKIDRVAADLAPDAEWRKEALDRIEKVRKGDFKVIVQDKDGKPVPNADVTLNMFEHEYKFGVCMDTEYINGMPDLPNSGPTRFTENLEANFNSMVVGNGLKWTIYENEPDRAQSVIDVAKANHIKYVRGHALFMPVSPSDEYAQNVKLYQLINGSDKRSARERYEDFKKIVREHFHELDEKFPYIYEWDVTNEMPGRTYFYGLASEKQVLKDVYQIAKEELKHGQKLLMTDNRQWYDVYWELADNFVGDFNIDFDGFGMQGHSAIGSQGPYEGKEACIDELMQVWDRFTYEYGKTFAITEFSLGAIKDEARWSDGRTGEYVDAYKNEYSWEGQGDYFRDYLIALFSHPGSTGITIWWLYDQYMNWNNIFNPRNAEYNNIGAGVSPLYGEWFVAKPGLVQYQDLVYNKWWTRNAKTKTDENGIGTIRGFYGDYKVNVKVNGKSKTYKVAFHKGYENEYVVTWEG